MENKNEKYQVEVETLQAQLTDVLKSKEDVLYEKTIMEEELTCKINTLDLELQKFKEQEENIVRSANKLEKIIEDLNDTLRKKDEEMKEFVKLQEEMELKLKTSQEDVIFKFMFDRFSVFSILMV